MGIFNKNRSDGQTYDGQGDDRSGMIDRIKYNGLEDELVWKFPYENLSIGAQLIVNESQEAIFYKGGTVCDILGPGTHTLSSSNIPILQKLINLPFGGNTPFTAEVWFINKTVKRNLKWGTKARFELMDPVYGIPVPVGAFGQFGIRINDSGRFMKEIVGTKHLKTTDEVISDFISEILNKVQDTIGKYIDQMQLSILRLPARISEISQNIQSRIRDEFDRYGVEITNFYVDSINYSEDDPGIVKIKEQMAISAAQVRQAMSNKQQRDIEGYTYQQERSFDVMETAAGNEGSAGNVMGAGMGLGMGFGIGGAMGNMMGAMGGQMNMGIQNQQQPTVPPPPPVIMYYIFVNNQQLGPFNIQQLTDFVKQGQLTGETLVWKQGMPQWSKAIDQPDLQTLFQPVAPPPPPPPPIN
ncbi:MAG TPA: SPFH domain-containing protein [Bacteroidia bacterium]|nr:SPFH domain-containing protein [Bacteroidia bacterium]HRS59109.1 SPFH domain-containing protein [Bacteroidia bacterium]HRU69122.1 SPFH domain-containing protein [Bacteroidia bacterium]